MKSHDNRIVVITGAGSGIGAAIAQAYCGEGAAVGLIDVNLDAAKAQAENLQRAGYRAAFAVADVADYAACAAACEEIERQLGAIDTLVNNAGVSPKHGGSPAPAFEMDPSEWRRVVDINLNGAFNMVRVLSPAMVQRRFGRIVNLSSVAGKAYLDLVAVHYGATKAAIIGFTRHLAGELGPYGITVNAIAPGRIDTPLLRTVSQQANDAIVGQTPLRRLGTPEEVANAVCFLTSAKADFITGQVIDVAGGWLMT